MTYERFEDLPVWQLAADVGADMLIWSQRAELRRLGDLPNQIQRATVSISNNIAEGFERGTTNELICFLYYARGSAGEVRSMLCVLERMITKGAFDHQSSAVSNFKSDIANFKSRCESISKQIRGWASSLQNSDITSQRHLNDTSRQKYEHKKKYADFDANRRQFIEHNAQEWRDTLQARVQPSQAADS